MAIIYSYPSAAPQTGDYVIGTQYDQELEKNRTVQFQIGQMVSLITENYTETTITVTNAQLTALQGQNVQILTAPGAGKVLKILEVSAYLDFDTAAFTFAQPILLQYKNDGSGSAGTIATIDKAFLQLAADAVYMAQPVSGRAGIDESILISTSGAVGAGGNTTLKLKLRYQVLDTANF